MEADLFCQKCGGNVVPNSHYCQHCGAPLSESPSALKRVTTILMGGSSVELLQGESILFEIPNALLLTNKRVAAMSKSDGKKTFASAFIKDIDAVKWETEQPYLGCGVLGILLIGIAVGVGMFVARNEAVPISAILAILGIVGVLLWLTERKSWLVFWVGGNQFIRADASGIKSHQKVQDFVNRFSELKDIAST